MFPNTNIVEEMKKSDSEKEIVYELAFKKLKEQIDDEGLLFEKVIKSELESFYQEGVYQGEIVYFLFNYSLFGTLELGASEIFVEDKTKMVEVM